MALGSTYLGQTYLGGSGYVNANVGGAVVSTSTMSGTITTDAPLSGAIVSTSVITGAMYTPGVSYLTGTIVSVSTVTGTVTTTAPLAGSIVSSSTMSGQTTIIPQLSGTIASTSVMSGTLGITVFVYTTFTPPVLNDRPLFSDTDSEAQKGLMKFMKPLNARYVNVFQLSDGTFVQDTPTPENANCNIPYPWDPNNPSAPYVQTVAVDYSVTPPVLKTTNTSHSVWITKVYNGVTAVDQGTVDLLISAGYRDRLS